MNRQNRRILLEILQISRYYPKNFTLSKPQEFTSGKIVYPRFPAKININFSPSTTFARTEDVPITEKNNATTLPHLKPEKQKLQSKAERAKLTQFCLGKLCQEGKTRRKDIITSRILDQRLDGQSWMTKTMLLDGMSLFPPLSRISWINKLFQELSCQTEDPILRILTNEHQA